MKAFFGSGKKIVKIKKKLRILESAKNVGMVQKCEKILFFLIWNFLCLNSIIYKWLVYLSNIDAIRSVKKIKINLKIRGYECNQYFKTIS